MQAAFIRYRKQNIWKCMRNLPCMIELMHASTRSRLNHVVILLRGELLDAPQRTVCTASSAHYSMWDLASPSHYTCITIQPFRKSIVKKENANLKPAVLRTLLNAFVLTVMHPCVCLLDQHMPVEEQLRLNFTTHTAKRLLCPFFMSEGQTLLRWDG